MQPNIGKIVYVKRFDNEAYLPAIILRTEGQLLHLSVFTREGVEYMTSDERADSAVMLKQGQWCWPVEV